jgi:hypothetical protein
MVISRAKRGFSFVKLLVHTCTLCAINLVKAMKCNFAMFRCLTYYYKRVTHGDCYMSQISSPAVHSECAPAVTAEIISGLHKTLAFWMSELEGIMSEHDPTTKLQVEFKWISIFTKKGDREKVGGINYRLKSALMRNDEETWKVVSVYEENFGSNFEDNAVFDVKFFTGYVAAGLDKVQDVLLPYS